MIRTVIYCVDDISTPFVVKDIRMLSERYDKVLLFSCELLPEKDILPHNVKVIEAYVNWQGFNGMGVLLKHIFSLFGIYLRESLLLRKPLPLKRSLALLSSNRYKATEMLRHLHKEALDPASEILYYSFWFYDCIYLAFIKKWYSRAKVLARAHSGDLYEDHISIRNNILFRHFQLQYLDGLFPVSRMGEAYLKARYRASEQKIKALFLGTDDPGILNPFDPGHFVLVSCASIRHHKRIHRIAEALLHIDFPLTWVHFGDENLHTSDPKIPEYIRFKKALEQKTNIRYLPMGQTDNAAILDYYKRQPVSLFISLSAAEGIPVSIMEAISFGIPVLATDVGGCREIVNNQTGILIPLETEAHGIAKELIDFYASNKNTEKFRMHVREFWKQNFDKNKNYDDIYREINN